MFWHIKSNTAHDSRSFTNKEYTCKSISHNSTDPKLVRNHLAAKHAVTDSIKYIYWMLKAHLIMEATLNWKTVANESNSDWGYNNHVEVTPVMLYLLNTLISVQICMCFNFIIFLKCKPDFLVKLGNINFINYNLITQIPRNRMEMKR